MSKAQQLRRATYAAIPALAFVTAALGCTQAVESEEPDVAAITEALELEDGGLDMGDELPMFGSEELFDEAALPEPSEKFDDVMDGSPDVEAMNKPDAVVIHTTVMWGQFPGNPNIQQPRDWTGMLAVNRGALLVRRVVAFEKPTDELLPRNDKQVVGFTSVTLPHHDGLRLDIIDPTPEAPEPLVLTYATNNGPVFEIPAQAMIDGPKSKVVDELGNRIVVVGIHKPVDICQHGMIGGKWHALAQGKGRFIGVVAAPDGEPVGHMKGIYGVRENGKRVFFGKYINLDGEFRGIFGGKYGEGMFEGRWKHASGEVGALGGEYREDIPGPETGGHYIGRWAELSCDVPVGPGKPDQL